MKNIDVFWRASGLRRFFGIVCLLVCVTQTQIAALHAEDTAPKPDSKNAAQPQPLSAKQIYQMAVKNCVLIVVRTDEKNFGIGSGWLFDKERKLVITNFHVAGRNATAQVYFPDFQNQRPIADKDHYFKNVKPIAAEVLLADAQRDLAVLKLEQLPESAVAFALADESPSPGDTLYSIGNPGSSNALWVYTTGTVRQVYKSKLQYETGQLIDATIIEATSPINPGDSGGPAVDDQGKLVGVVAAFKADARLITRFIDVSEVKAFVKEIDELYDPVTADQFVRRGTQHRFRRNFTRALLDMTAALRINPNLTAAIYQRGKCFADQGDDETALADFNDTLKMDPKFVEGYRDRLKLYARQGRLDDLISDCTEVARLDPMDHMAVHIRGLAYFDKREFDKCITEMEKSLVMNPKHAASYFYRAESLRNQNKADLAIKDYIETIKTDAQYTDAYNRLGEVLLFVKRDPATAVTVFTDALKTNQNNFVALLERGRAQFLLDQMELALNDLNAAAKLNPRHPMIYDFRGDIFLARQDYDAALKDYRIAIDLDPKSAQLHTDAGVALLKLNKDADAVQEFDRAIELNSSFIAAYVQRAIANFKLGKKDQTLTDVATAKQLNPNLSEIEVKQRFTRYLRITNTLDEPVEVSIYYFSRTSKDDFAWFPTAPGKGDPLKVQIEPKRTQFVMYKDNRVHAAKIRISWRGLKSEKTFDRYATDDLLLTPSTGYVAAEGEIYDYTIFANSLSKAK